MRCRNTSLFCYNDTDMKKVLVLLLLGSLLPWQIQAEETPVSEEVEEKEEEKEEPKIDLVGPDVEAPSAILIDAETGTILAKKDPQLHFQPAALTKTMGVYLATEDLADTDKLKMSSEAFASYDHRASVIWIMEGEEVPAIDLEHAALIQNANDCMAMLAEGVSGSASNFINKMNETAQELGMANTYYQNIFGLYDENNYTSAEDVAILTRKALRNESFKKAYMANAYRIAPTAMQVNERVLAANCEMIREGSDYFENALGCQVGYTQEGGYNVSVLAQRGNTSLIAVVLGGSSEKGVYNDAKTLFNYGFAEYQTITITPEQIGTKEIEVYEGTKHIADVTFSVDTAFQALLPSSIDPNSLVVEIKTENEESSNPDDIKAEVIFKLDGKQVGSADMKREIKRIGVAAAMPERSPFFVGVDYASIAILGILVLRYLGRALRPNDTHLNDEGNI